MDLVVIKIKSFSRSMYIYLSVCVGFLCGYLHVSAMPTESRRGHQIPWSWSYRILWAIWCGCWELNPSPLRGEKRPIWASSGEKGMVVNVWVFLWHRHSMTCLSACEYLWPIPPKQLAEQPIHQRRLPSDCSVLLGDQLWETNSRTITKESDAPGLNIFIVSETTRILYLFSLMNHWAADRWARPLIKEPSFTLTAWASGDVQLLPDSMLSFKTLRLCLEISDSNPELQRTLGHCYFTENRIFFRTGELEKWLWLREWTLLTGCFGRSRCSSALCRSGFLFC